MKAHFSRMLATILLAAVLPAIAAHAADVPASINTEEIVKNAAYNELHAHDNHPYRFTLRKDDNGRITTKEIIETKTGDVARLIAIDDKPLTAKQNEAEIRRLQKLLADPSIEAHRLRGEQKDSHRANEMIRLLPTAFLYTYKGMVQGPSGPAYRFSMVPNPNFNPPDRQAEVYHGMAGELWIDQRHQRMVRLDMHLISDVDFGWGIIGKLFKGGTILVEQKDVGQNHWEQTLLNLHLNGKILIVKPLVIDTHETESDFAAVPPDWTYEDAARELLSEKH